MNSADSTAADRRAAVAVAMSGGVDSSVAAALLTQRGLRVVGLTMQLFDRRTGSEDYPERGCCSLDAVHRAEAVCHTLKIPHYTVNLINDFKQYVIDDFVNEYIAGRTPNPCVRCNTFLKWGSLFRKAKMLGCNYLATGHYARIEHVGREVHLLRAGNPEKDQAYALWGIPRDLLPHTLFPLGTLRKEEVRRIASDLGLKSAETPESQEICFIPSGDYAEFLKQKRPDFFARLGPGELCEEGDESFKSVGAHRGYPFYTIGQRKGLGGGFPSPRYVLRLEAEQNRVIIGNKSRLFKVRFVVDQLNWLIADPTGKLRADVQVRYRSPAFPATLQPIAENKTSEKTKAIVTFDQPVEAIAPGQSAVFFQSDRVIGGGRIVEIFE
jgi:tRNA-specific 2-thiouridylase